MHPERHLRLRATHFSILKALALDGVEVVSIANLLNRIQLHLGLDHAQSSAALNRLKAEGVFRAADETGNELELPAEIRNDVLWLCDRQRATSPSQLKALIEEIGQRTQQLEQFVRDNNTELTLSVLEKLRQEASDIAAICAQNRRAVVAAVMESKSKQDGRSLRQRYYHVADLHDRYIEPMRRIVDPHGPLDDALNDASKVATLAEQTFQSDPKILFEIDRLRFRITSLRRQARDDFIVTSKEVVPLYNQLRRDSQLADAVAARLEQFHRDGPGCFDFKTHLPVSTFRVDGLFSYYYVENYLDAIGRQVRARRKPVRLKDLHGAGRKIITDEDLFERMRSALPIANALEWVFAEYGSDVPEADLLRAFSGIVLNSEITKRLFVGAETTFRFGDITYRHHPVEVIHVP